jgi:hypothetical protein
MSDSSLQVEWDADREWIAEHTSWDRDGPAPDIIAAGVTAEQAFGGTDLVEVARRKNAEGARLKWADSGMGKIRRSAVDLAVRRCRSARMAVDASLRDGPSAAPYVREWWKLNFQLQALLDLLPPDEQPRLEVPTKELEATAALLGKESPTIPEPSIWDELVIPETWRGRTPKPERDAKSVFEGRHRDLGGPDVAEEVKKWAVESFCWYKQWGGCSAKEAKDKVMGIAESHDYHFVRRGINRWK